MIALRSCLLFAGLILPSLAQQISQSVSPEAPGMLVLRDLSGETKRLSAYRGKVVVLNFWATWCVPCREEMPLLVGVQRRYGNRGIAVIGVSADDESTQPKIPGFLQELGIGFPIWKGATTRDMQLLGLGTDLPATAVIDQEGRLAFRILGILDRKELEQRLEYLLGNHSGAPPEPLVDSISEAIKPPQLGVHEQREQKHSHGGVGMEGASTVPS